MSWRGRTRTAFLLAILAVAILSIVASPDIWALARETSKGSAAQGPDVGAGSESIHVPVTDQATYGGPASPDTTVMLIPVADATIQSAAPNTNFGVTETLEKMYEILSGTEWRKLEAKLLTFVDNYNRRIVEATGGFQL